MELVHPGYTQRAGREEGQGQEEQEQEQGWIQGPVHQRHTQREGGWQEQEQRWIRGPVHQRYTQRAGRGKPKGQGEEKGQKQGPRQRQERERTLGRVRPRCARARTSLLSV